MPNVYPKKGTKYLWCWGSTVDGTRWDESTKQTDPKAAKLAAREIERRYAADANWKAKSRLTVEAAIDQVLEYQRKAGKAEATIRATTYHGRHLVQHLGATTSLAGITLADTTKYLQKRLGEDASRHTIAKELRTLTQAMRRAAKLGQYVPKQAPEHFVPDELGTVYEPRDRWLTREEYAQLLEALAPQKAGKKGGLRHHTEDRRDYVIAWCNLGLRKSELFDIQPGDYDAKRRELRVRGTKTEGADRLVPVNEAAAEVLARRCKRDKPFPEWETVTRDLARACDRAQKAAEAAAAKAAAKAKGKAKPVPPFLPVTPNDLRRTFCSWLCQSGVSERYCAELLGHESTTMVRAVYGHLDRAALKAAVARL